MKTRIKVRAVYPEAYKPLYDLGAFLETTGLDHAKLELMKIRASQINNCGYCMDLHISRALKNGEDARRIHVLSAWREAPQWFNEEEQLMLAMTEEITLIHEHGLSDELYGKAIALFGEIKTVQVVMVIVQINAWNRIIRPFNLHPGDDH